MRGGKPEPFPWRPLDLSRPVGAYEIDRFLGCFSPKPIDLDNKIKRAALDLLRWEVCRVARIAYVRATREPELEPTRREAKELLEAIARVRPGLARLLRQPNDCPADFVARMVGVLRRKPGKAPADTLTVTLTQVFDDAASLLAWIDELDGCKIVPPGAPRTVPLPRALSAGAVALYRQRLGKLPPANREHWLAEFCVAAWLDFQLPMSLLPEDPVGYFGAKIIAYVKTAKAPE